jgi:hypothetical protein
LTFSELQSVISQKIVLFITAVMRPSNPIRVEAGTNTSTVALGVVGGDEKGAQCLGV